MFGDDIETWSRVAQMNAKATAHAAAEQRAAVVRDANAPFAARPADAALPALLAALTDAGLCAPSASVLPPAQVLDNFPLPVGVLCTPLGDESVWTRVDASCPLCSQCGAALNAFSALNSRAQWVCRYCGTDNDAPAERYGAAAAAQQWNALPELSACAVQWNEGAAEHLMSTLDDTIVVLLDTTIASADLRAVCATLLETLRDAAAAVTAASPLFVVLVTYGNVVQMHHLDAATQATALCFADGPASVRAAAGDGQRDETAQDLLAAHLARVRVPLSAPGTLAAIALALECVAPSDSHRRAPRELWNALLLADALFATDAGRLLARHRIVALLGGPPAPSRDWAAMQLTAASVDFVVVSGHHCQLADLQLWAARRCVMPAVPFAHFSSAPDTQRALQATLAALMCPVARSAPRVRVRAAGVRVERVTGAAVTARLIVTGNSARETLALYLAHPQDGLSYCSVQIEAQYVDMIGRRQLRRVLTVALPLVAAAAPFHGALSAPVCAALLARSYLTAPTSPAWLDTAMRKAVRHFGGAAAWPPALAQLPFMVHCARAHPMALQRDDDHFHALRQVFLRCSLADALRILVPAVHLVGVAASVDDDGAADALTALPPEDLCLHDANVLVMDTYAHLLIWSGAATLSPTGNGDARRARALDHCLAVAATREPPPLIMSFRSGDGGQRWLEAQLSPAHKDAAADHVGAFPYLAAMGDDERRRFMASFMHTDELSFLQWWRQICREQ